MQFYAFSGHKQPPDDQTIQFWHQASKQFWKLWSTWFFGTKFRGDHNWLITVGGFFNKREYCEAEWLVPVLVSGFLFQFLKVGNLIFYSNSKSLKLWTGFFHSQSQCAKIIPAHACQSNPIREKIENDQLTIKWPIADLELGIWDVFFPNPLSKITNP